MGAGKTTVIKRLAAEVSPQTETLWFGTGFPYSLKRATRDETSILEWVSYRQRILRQLSACTDLLLMERSSFCDFSNLCFRKRLITAAELLPLTRSWWPTFVVLIATPFDDCLKNMVKRGDTPDVTDLVLFQESLDQTREFLKELLGPRLVIVGNGDEAYEFARTQIRIRRT